MVMILNFFSHKYSKTLSTDINGNDSKTCQNTGFSFNLTCFFSKKCLICSGRAHCNNLSSTEDFKTEVTETKEKKTLVLPGEHKLFT